MSSRRMVSGCIALLAAALVLLWAPGVTQAYPDEEEKTTQDIIHMADGRVLEGHIVSEDPRYITFEYVDRNLDISTKLALSVDQIIKIERDVPIPEKVEETRSTSRTRKKKDPPASQQGSRYGVGLIEADAENVPVFYRIPMKGQMGTDINVDVYEEMVEDIRALDPDYLLIEMESIDAEDRLYSRISQQDKGFDDSSYLDMYRELVSLFRDDLRDIDQVLWIHDSHGISSIIALSWEQMYMKPEGRLGGVAGAAENFAVQDPEVYAKFREGYMAWLKGFAEYGRYPLELVDAMVLPEKVLSASWKGRAVNWGLDTNGEYLVDGDDESTADFVAKDAEDLLISDGTAETLDEVVLLMGFREYRLAEGEGESVFEDYREDWRRLFENCEVWLKDYQQYLGWATGEDTLKYLGRAKSTLEDIIAAANRYKAVEVRLLTDYGVRVFDLQTQIEQIKEQIRALRQRDRNRGGGGGRQGGGAGASGVGGGGRR